MELFGSLEPWPFNLAFSGTFGTIGLFFLFLGGAVEADGRGARTPENDRLVLLWFVLAVGFLLLALLPPAAWIVHAVAQNRDALDAALGDPRTIPAALFLGLGLFWLRERRRFIYGLLEVLGSVIAVTAAVLAAPGLLGKIAGLLSGIYVLIRGVDNMRQAPRPARRRGCSSSGARCCPTTTSSRGSRGCAADTAAPSRLLGPQKRMAGGGGGGAARGAARVRVPWPPGWRADRAAPPVLGAPMPGSPALLLSARGRGGRTGGLDEILEHRAVVLKEGGCPIAVVRERYRSALVCFAG